MAYLTDFLQRYTLPQSYLLEAEQTFQPVLTNILAQCKQNKNQLKSTPIFVGINGCQGSGKSTLADYLSTQLIHLHQLKTIFFSLDDFYFSQDKRVALAKNIHPLLKTRGVPGTHNIDLLAKILTQLSQNQSNNQGELVIPVFDKLADNPKPLAQWQKINLPVDVVIIEGWCWGVSAQNEQDLATPINQLETNFDTDGVWRKYVNQQLQQYYQPLYRYIDLWLMLKAPSFTCVKQWRLEQEVKQVKNKRNASNYQGMNATEIDAFIQHFQRITEHSFTKLTKQVDYLFCLDEQRKITI